MQIDANIVYRGQTDFVPEANQEESWTIQRKQICKMNQQANADSECALEKSPKEHAETYQASEEGLMKLYLEQLKNAQKKSKDERNARNEELKAIKIAHNIMRGYKVPAQDESFLLTKNYKMYMAAKNIGMMRECRGEAKSVLASGGNYSGEPQTQDGSLNTSIAAGEFLVGAEESAITNTGILSGQKDQQDNKKSSVAYKNNSFAAYNAYKKTQEYGKMTANRFQSKKKMKARKRFYYNFKDVSSRVVRAKTSGIARQVLASAKQRTAILRRKMKTGEYDDEALRIAIVHAEAMERVAKKKMKHLQEEEICKRGGPCAGDTEREDIKEQMRQDEQAQTERLREQDAGGNLSKFDTFSSILIESEVSFDQMSLEELMADAVQSDAQMLDLVSGMELFIEDFASLMKDTMEQMDGLSELAEELMGVSATPDMDPEDLKELKTKHRTEEQRKIAEADSKYLRALFQKLQREQQAVAQGAAKIAEAIIGSNSTPTLSLTGASSSGGTPSAPKALSTAGGSISSASEAPVELIGLSTAKETLTADIPVVSSDVAVAAVATFDISI